MNRKTFWLVSVFVLSAMLVLSLGYIQAQTENQVAKFDADGNPVDSDITEIDGNVGLGTASPGQKLTVQTETANYGLVHTDGVRSVGTWVGLFGGADGGWYGTLSNHPLYFFTNGGAASMTLTTAGSFGIGTTNPAVKLHVIGNRIRLQNAGKVLDMRADGAAVDLQSFTDNLFLRSNGPSGNNNIIMQPFPGDGDGNVGIGTTSPGTRLDVMTTGSVAVRGQAATPGACAIDGVATATTGASDGVRGMTNSTSGRGVIAVSAGGGAVGNLGLQVLGRGRATGGFSTGSGSIEIDHPFDPANKYLHHSFVGSPDMKNIYDGVVVLDDKGEAQVDLPEWFEAINRDFRYQLTCIGGFAPVYVAEKISGNRFKISGGQPGLEVSWQVSGIRKDPYAEKYRVQVEEEKPAIEKGLYLHPDVYGQPQTKSIEWGRNPELMKRMSQERE